MADLTSLRGVGRHPRRKTERRPRLPRPIRLRPQIGTTTLPLPRRWPEPLPLVTLPRQYRLAIIRGLTDDEIEAFIASGFVDHATFGTDAAGRWHQTKLEADEPTPIANDDL